MTGVKYGLYAMYDMVTEEYGCPMLAKNDGHIKKIAQKQLEGRVDASDYKLRCLGTMNVETGLIEPLSQPRTIHFGMKIEVENEGENYFPPQPPEYYDERIIKFEREGNFKAVQQLQWAKEWAAGKLKEAANG